MKLFTRLVVGAVALVLATCSALAVPQSTQQSPLPSYISIVGTNVAVGNSQFSTLGPFGPNATLHNMLNKGSPTGYFQANSFGVKINSPVLQNGGTGAPGTIGCACVAAVYGFIWPQLGFDAVEAQAGVFSVNLMTMVITTSDLVGVTGNCTVLYPTTDGTVAGARCYGASISATVGQNGSTPQAVGAEVDHSINQQFVPSVGIAYDPATGRITLDYPSALPQVLQVGWPIMLKGVTGTGAVASLAGSWPVLQINNNWTELVVQGPAGLSVSNLGGGVNSAVPYAFEFNALALGTNLAGWHVGYNISTGGGRQPVFCGFCFTTRGGQLGAPVDVQGYIMSADSAFTVKQAFYFPQLTASGFYFKFPNFSVSGAGAVVSPSTAQFAAYNVNTAAMGTPGGLLQLDGNGIVPVANARPPFSTLLGFYTSSQTLPAIPAGVTEILAVLQGGGGAGGSCAAATAAGAGGMPGVQISFKVGVSPGDTPAFVAGAAGAAAAAGANAGGNGGNSTFEGVTASGGTGGSGSGSGNASAFALGGQANKVPYVGPPSNSASPVMVGSSFLLNAAPTGSGVGGNGVGSPWSQTVTGASGANGSGATGPGGAGAGGGCLGTAQTGGPGGGGALAVFY